ncbi:MAG: hypothetical protein R2852_09205 [Bacteroidia bacterium]
MSSHIKFDLKQEKKMFLGLDGKNSIILDFPIKLFGLQVGYTYNNRTNLYAGFYTSHRDTGILSNPTGGNTIDSNTILQKLKLTYINFGCEYNFHDTKKWRLSIPFAIGIGGGRTKLYGIDGTISDKSYTVIPVEAGFNAKYKLTWWLWIGAGLGTRLSLASSKFNGSFYTFGLSIKTGEIYRRVKTHIQN